MNSRRISKWQNISIKRNGFSIEYVSILILFVILTNSCKKNEVSSSIKIDPIITWTNPADILYGTLLNSTHLNALANVEGSFIYTPKLNTKLNIGLNQNLKTDFRPNDTTNYNAVSKTVKINVIQGEGSGGISNATFNTSKTYGTVTDIDGNVYKTITIGTQTWMAENLRTARYQNGVSIPEVTNYAMWKVLSTGAYCNYGNTSDKNVIATYGRLYNWYVVNNVNKISPQGWHVPAHTDWDKLNIFLGGAIGAGTMMKETGTSHWISSYTAARNESGFTALPGGLYSSVGFHGMGETCYYWCSSPSDSNYAYTYNLIATNSLNFGTYLDKKIGISIRCVKD